jgi:hypothetical protein
MTQKFAAVKDPDSVLDYKINWTIVMENNNPVDTISTSTWDQDGGVTLDSDSYTDTHATVWVSGGTLGEYVNLTNTILTVGGRTLVRTIKLSIKET